MRPQPTPITTTLIVFLRADGAVILAYILITLVFTWPMPLYFRTHVLGAPGDNFEYLWKLWWIPHALFERGISPWFVPEIYYPSGYLLAYGEVTALHTFLQIPATLLLGEVTTYNLIVFASFPFSGWAVYRLARRWSGSSVEGQTLAAVAGPFFAGAAFAFSSYRAAQLIGHLPLVSTQWVVIAVWMMDRWLGTRNFRDAVLVGLASSAAALSSWYYAFMLIITLPTYLFAREGRGIVTMLKERRAWGGAALMALIAVGVCTPFAIPYFGLGADSTIPDADAAYWGASPADYLLPNPRHPLWGSAIQRAMWPYPEPMPQEFAARAIGLTTLTLALWVWRKRRGSHWRALKWLMIICMVLSFGPELFFGRVPLGIPMPALALRSLPIAASMRTWGRFSLVVMMGMSLLAGEALWESTVPGRAVRRPRLAVLIALALMLFESYTIPLPLTRVGPRRVDQWLAEQPGQFAVMQYPFWEALSGPSMLYQRYHGKWIVYGYGTFLPLVYEQRHPELGTFPDDPALDRLASWDVRFILVRVYLLNDPPFAIMVEAQPRLRYVITLDDEAVYELIEPDG